MKPKEFLCKNCIVKMREYDRKRKRKWLRKLKVKVVSPQEDGKVDIIKNK